MKSVLIILCCSITLSSCQSENEKVVVPNAIQAAFIKQYPDAGRTMWEKENDRYEATYKRDNQEVGVTYNIDGSVYQTELEISPETLPQSIRDYVASNLKDKKITEATKIVSATGQTSYEAEVDKIDYLFDSTGAFAGEEAKDDGEKDDND